ncbi:MAG: hypothetical protein ACRDDX_10515 [Cellulosilyticaceae bacterium]
MCSIDGLKQHIGQSNIEETQLKFLLDAYLTKVSSLIGKDLLLEAYQETIKGDGQQCIYLEVTPVFDVIQVLSEDGALPTNTYQLIGNAIYKDGGWQGKYTTVGMSAIKYSSLENYIVIYRAGYLTQEIIQALADDGEDVTGLKPNFPQDLELLIYESVKNHINAGGKEIKAYAIDDVRYEYVTMNESYIDVLKKYKGE